MIRSHIRVKEILACFYQHRKPNYKFSSSSHSYFEFTYVDSGQLYTIVDNKEYILHSSQCMLYYPNQKHSQHTDAFSGCSCLTILFEMEMNIPESLKNKIILASQQIRLEMKRFIKEIQFDSWMHTEMSLVIFQRILIQALWEQRNSLKTDKENSTDTELDPILLYIEKGYKCRRIVSYFFRIQKFITKYVSQFFKLDNKTVYFRCEDEKGSNFVTGP